jgi:hypothetical protein
MEAYVLDCVVLEWEDEVSLYLFTPRSSILVRSCPVQRTAPT